MSIVSDDIFVSSSAKQILVAIEFAAFAGLENAEEVKGRDVVIVIKNYAEDRLDFGLAIEQARARYPGLNIMSVINTDGVCLLAQMRGEEEEEGTWGEHLCV